MTMDPKPRPSKSDGESTPSSTLQSINKTNDVVSTTLHRTIQQHVRNKEYDAEKEGLDFVQAKNGLLLSYLVDLTLLLRCRLNRCNGDDQQQTRQEGECLARLNEMKAVLEKARPLEKRMRYQIDKLLALSTLGAGTFAAVGREEEEKEADAGSDDEEVGAEREEGLKNSDPLSFKPDLQGMMKMFEEDGDEQNGGNSDDESDASNEDNAPTSKPKISLEKDDEAPPGVYQPPRHQSVPFELDNNEARMAKEERLLEKARDKQSRSELTALLKSQYTDAPEEEDVRGGTQMGKQSEKSRKLAAQDRDIAEFEETQMIRLTMGRKEKKERKRAMRDEFSNLGAIAGGMGGLTAGVDEAFGDNRGRRGSDVEGSEGIGSYKMKGMRKRRVEVLEGGTPRKGKSKRKKGASNQYQKSLYGK